MESRKWHKLSYLQSRNRNMDIQNQHMDAKEGEEGWNELGD